MKCRCGHRKDKHYFGSGKCETWVEHLDARQSKYCDCHKFQPEEERMDEKEIHNYAMLNANSEAGVRILEAIECQKEEERQKFAAEQEHLRRRELFERIVIGVAGNPRMKTPLAVAIFAEELLARTLEKEEG